MRSSSWNVFDAPRELVWKALTEAERIPRWWGKRHTTMTVEEMDVRVGGRWRWVAHPDGDAPFSGEYLEIDPPAGSSTPRCSTCRPTTRAGDRDPDARGDRREDEADQPIRFPSAEALEGALATGMVGGAIESWDRLEEEAQRG